MPLTGKNGEPVKSELPGTIQRSPKEAQETFAKAHDSAAQTYGGGQRAQRVAYSALKHKFEKKGDRWVKKDGRGPSGRRTVDPKSRKNHGKSFGGADVQGDTREELYKRAAELDVQGRSKMNKEQLAEAIARVQG